MSCSLSEGEAVMSRAASEADVLGVNGSGPPGVKTTSHSRFAHSLMALNVSLKFSLFGTRYKISSVTRQPVRGSVRRQCGEQHRASGSRRTLRSHAAYRSGCGYTECPSFSGWSPLAGPGCLGWTARPVWQKAGRSTPTERER